MGTTSSLIYLCIFFIFLGRVYSDIPTTPAIKNATFPSTPAPNFVSSSTVTATPSDPGFPLYDINSIPLTPSKGNVVFLPCWNETLKRAGRIQLSRQDFAKLNGSEIQFQLQWCPREYFGGGSSLQLPGFSDDLFIHIRTEDFWSNETIIVTSDLKLDGTITTTRYSAVFAESQMESHALLLDPTPNEVWSMGPRFSVKFQKDAQTGNLSSTVAYLPASTNASNITDLSNQRIITIDYTVVLRSNNLMSTYEAARYFIRNPTEMYYCSPLQGFIPSQLCKNRKNNNLNITTCPSNSFLPPTPTSQNSTGKEMNCLSPEGALPWLANFTPRTTQSWFYPTFPTWFYPTFPTVRTIATTRRPTYSYTYTYDYTYRNIGLAVGLSCALLSIFCTGLKYCCKCMTKENQNQLRARQLANSSHESSRRASDCEGPRVFGALPGSIEHPPPAYQGRNRDDPPAYHEVFKPFGNTAPNPSTEILVDLNAPPPVFVIPQPPRASGNRRDGEVNTLFVPE